MVKPYDHSFIDIKKLSDSLDIFICNGFKKHIYTNEVNFFVNITIHTVLYLIF